MSSDKTNDELVEEILDIKEDVATWEKKLSTMEGKLEQEMTHLSDDYDVGSVKDAEAVLAKTTRRSSKLRKQIEKGLEELKDEFDLTA